MIYADDLYRIPSQGPLLLAMNHINFLDIPILFTNLQPRKVTGLIKVETWNNPLLAALFNIWGGIPIKRGESDLVAFRKAADWLKAGNILGVSPEGTRSGNGILKKGLPGIVMLAQKTDVPIQVVAIYGGEVIWDNLRRLTRTPFHIKTGKIFRIDCSLRLQDRDLRQLVTDQLMYKIAELLPARYRGEYFDLEKMHDDYFVFTEQSQWTNG